MPCIDGSIANKELRLCCCIQWYPQVTNISKLDLMPNISDLCQGWGNSTRCRHLICVWAGATLFEVKWGLGAHNTWRTRTMATPPNTCTCTMAAPHTIWRTCTMAAPPCACSWRETTQHSASSDNSCSPGPADDTIVRCSRFTCDTPSHTIDTQLDWHWHC